jgi:hypothetical protein
MREYLPILIVGAAIGFFTLIFVAAYALEKNKKETMGFDRHMEDSEIIRRLLVYAKPHWPIFLFVLFIMLFTVAYDIVAPLIVGYIEELVKEDFALCRLFEQVDRSYQSRLTCAGETDDSVGIPPLNVQVDVLQRDHLAALCIELLCDPFKSYNVFCHSVPF